MTSNQEKTHDPSDSVVKEKTLSFIGYKKSRSGKKKKKRSLRMLHFQIKKAQSKLVSFVNGVCCCCPMLGPDKAFNLSMQFKCTKIKANQSNDHKKTKQVEKAQ